VNERLTAVADPELRETLLFARRRRDPVTADDTAEHLGVHRNVARARLDRLAATGLLEIAFERRTGRSGPGAGRPAKIYAVAPELEAIEFPRRRYEQLVGALLDVLPRRGRARTLRAAGEAFGRDLADAAGLRPTRGLRKGLERMCDAVAQLGFQASVVEAERGRAVIATPTCPLRPLVAARPDAAEVDRGMWAGLLERAVSGVRAESVSCETQNCTDGHAACRVVLRLRQEASASGGTASR
jgi:predicted ArsR family transcriptional regulator